ATGRLLAAPHRGGGRSLRRPCGRLGRGRHLARQPAAHDAGARLSVARRQRRPLRLRALRLRTLALGMDGRVRRTPHHGGGALIRALSPGEIALAREAFGEALPYDLIRFLPAPWPLTRAFVPGRWFGRGWIVWPAGALPADIAAAPLGAQATFIHELTHVWQAWNGV